MTVVSAVIGLPAILVVTFIKHRGTEIIHQILRWSFHFAMANVQAALRVGALVACFLVVDWIAGPFHIVETPRVGLSARGFRGLFTECVNAASNHWRGKTLSAALVLPD